MSDKEPRRRKKRKDSQSRKDDIRSDDQIFMTSKSDTKDSDPEVEEEKIVVPSCQPSGFAKFVFVILFSGLVLSMSFIFISLHGADNDAIGVFDEHLEEHHAEEIDLSHDDSHDDDHDDDHDEPGGTWNLKDGFQGLSDSIEDILPGIGSILSFKGEHVEESDKVTAEEGADALKDANEMPEESSTIEYDTFVEQSTTEEIEDTSQPEEDLIASEIFIETSTEPYQEQYPEDSSYNQETTSNPTDLEFEPVSEEQEFENTSPYTYDESDFSTQPPDVIPETSYYSDSPDEVSTPSSFETTSDGRVHDEDSFTEPEIREEETFPYYENVDITNEDDFGIRKELDELDADLGKELPDDDNSDDDDDDDYEGEGTEDEFEFWQF